MAYKKDPEKIKNEIHNKKIDKFLSYILTSVVSFVSGLLLTLYLGCGL